MKIKYKVYLTIIFILINTVVISQESWNWQRPQPQGNTLNDIFTLDNETAVAVGESGIIIKTNNSGENWQIMDNPESITLNSVYFIDDKTGWTVGYYAFITIYKYAYSSFFDLVIS